MDNVDEKSSNLDDRNRISAFDLAVAPKNIIPVDKACNDAHIRQVFLKKYNAMTRDVKYCLILKIKHLKNNIVT